MEITLGLIGYMYMKFNRSKSFILTCKANENHGVTICLHPCIFLLKLVMVSGKSDFSGEMYFIFGGILLEARQATGDTKDCSLRRDEPYLTFKGSKLYIYIYAWCSSLCRLSHQSREQ